MVAVSSVGLQRRIRAILVHKLAARDSTRAKIAELGDHGIDIVQEIQLVDRHTPRVPPVDLSRADVVLFVNDCAGHPEWMALCKQIAKQGGKVLPISRRSSHWPAQIETIRQYVGSLPARFVEPPRSETRIRVPSVALATSAPSAPAPVEPAPVERFNEIDQIKQIMREQSDDRAIPIGRAHGLRLSFRTDCLADVFDLVMRYHDQARRGARVDWDWILSQIPERMHGDAAPKSGSALYDTLKQMVRRGRVSPAFRRFWETRSNRRVVQPATVRIEQPPVTLPGKIEQIEIALSAEPTAERDGQIGDTNAANNAGIEPIDAPESTPVDGLAVVVPMPVAKAEPAPEPVHVVIAQPVSDDDRELARLYALQVEDLKREIATLRAELARATPPDAMRSTIADLRREIGAVSEENRRLRASNRNAPPEALRSALLALDGLIQWAKQGAA